MAVRAPKWQNPFGVDFFSKACYIINAQKLIHRCQVQFRLAVFSNQLLDLLAPNTYCGVPDPFRDAIDESLDLHLGPLHEP